MVINGTEYDVNAVKKLDLQEFSLQHENLPYFRKLTPTERKKELKSVFLKLGGTVKK